MAPLQQRMQIIEYKLSLHSYETPQCADTRSLGKKNSEICFIIGLQEWENETEP